MPYFKGVHFDHIFQTEEDVRAYARPEPVFDVEIVMDDLEAGPSKTAVSMEKVPPAPAPVAPPSPSPHAPAPVAPPSPSPPPPVAPAPVAPVAPVAPAPKASRTPKVRDGKVEKGSDKKPQ